MTSAENLYGGYAPNLVFDVPANAMAVVPVEQTVEQAVLMSRSEQGAIEIGRGHKIAGAIVGLLTVGALVSVFGPEDKPPVIAGANVVTSGDGIENGQEADYHIAGQGSCSPYTRADARAVARGEATVEVDLVDAETAFLKQHTAFAANYGQTSVSRIGYLWDSLGLDRPTGDDAQAAEAMVGVFEHENYTTAPLARPLEVMNTLCDKEGNVLAYRQVVLEAGTYVGGQQITKINGSEVTFASGQTRTLPAEALITKVKLSDGKEVSFLATHKAGINADQDPEAEVGCLNVLTKPAPPETRPPQDTTTTTTSTAPETRPPATTGTTTTTSTAPRPTTPTVPRKVDDGRLPGNSAVPADQDPGTPDKAGVGPAGQTPDEDGYLPTETPPSVPETTTTTHPQTSPTTNRPPATTGTTTATTNPPQPATTTVSTTAPQSGALPPKP